MDNCIFCQIIKKKVASIVYQNEFLIVIHDIKPKADIHLLIISKKHIKNLQFITYEDKNMLSEMLLVIPKLANLFNTYDSFRIVINNGLKAKQEINHMHFHFLGYK